MMSRVLTVVLLAIVAPVRATIVKEIGTLKALGRRPIANVQVVDSVHTCGPWARTLSNLGVIDRNQGRVEEARKEFGEALQIYRELAEKNPETCRPYIARTLNNLAVLDTDQDRVEEAGKEYAEALQIYRELAEKNPESYRPDLAATLNNLGVFDRNQGRPRRFRFAVSW